MGLRSAFFLLARLGIIIRVKKGSLSRVGLSVVFGIARFLRDRLATIGKDVSYTQFDTK